MFRRIIKYSSKYFDLFGNLLLITDKRTKPRIAVVKIVIAIICMHLSNLGSLNSLSSALASGRFEAESTSTIARVAKQHEFK